MTTYAVGDLQGCYKALLRLLDKINFDPAQDEIWFTGDLVNRGPESLQCLRLVYELGSAAHTVLGNHDLHALAQWYGKESPKKKDTLDLLFASPDCAELMKWLIDQPLAHYDKDRNLFISHAGIPNFWSVNEALSYAGELETVLRSDRSLDYFDEMYGNHPSAWHSRLQGIDRLRVITNFFTRMRFIDDLGQLNLTHKEGSETAPKGFKPWFEFPRQDDVTIVFGHWAALQGKTGNVRYQAIDTGCVWGGAMTALNLDSMERLQVAA